MIPLLVLTVAVIYAFFRPRRATMLVALISAFWFEWELPFGGRLGVFEVLFFGGLCGLLVGNSGLHLRLRIPCAKMVIAFIALSALSSIVVHNRDLFRLLWGAFKPAMFAASFFLFYLTLNDRASVDKVIRLFLISATVCTLIGLAQLFLHRPLGILFTGIYKADLDLYFDLNTTSHLRVFSTLGHSTVFGAFMIFPISLLGAMMLTNPDWRSWRFAWFALSVQAFALAASFSRAAWVGMFVSALVAVWVLKIYRHPRFWPVVLSLAVLSLSAVYLRILPASFVSRVETLKHAEDDPSMLPRYERWSYFFYRSLQSPWLGQGIVTDETAVKDLQYAVSPHNTFIFLAVQRGWIPTAIMTGILFVIWRKGWETIRLAPNRYFLGISTGLFAGAVGTYAIAAMFTTLWEDLQSSVAFWLFSAITLRFRELAGQAVSIPEGAVTSSDDTQVAEGARMQ